MLQTAVLALVACAAARAGDAPVAAHSVAESPALSTLAEQPALDQPQQRERFETFAEALSSQAYSEAEVAAKQMVEAANSRTSANAVERARSLHNLAIAQHYLDQPDAALQNFQAAIDVVSANDHMLSVALIGPLRGKARTQAARGDTEASLESLDWALHVSKVNYGPHSFEQLPILLEKLDSFLESGETGEVRSLVDAMDNLYSRRFDRRSPEWLPALYRKAEVYDMLNMGHDEVHVWWNVLDIKESYLDDNDPELIEPHLNLARLGVRGLRRQHYRSITTSDAERHLKKALSIAENNPDSDWIVLNRCLLAIGDFYLLFDMRPRANRYYKRAWELLAAEPDRAASLATAFSAPVLVSRPKIDPYANFEYDRQRGKPRPEDFVPGEMLLSFTVNERGRIKDVSVQEADPAGFERMERRARNDLEGFVYRPRFEAGRPAPTSDQSFRLRYFYLPVEYRASVEKSRR